MEHIKDLNIISYRGIKNLKISKFGKFNIILGDNNSGKTSLLEAIQFVAKSQNLAEIMYLARQRERFKYMPFRRTSILDSLLYMFNLSDEKEYRIEMSSSSLFDDEVEVILKGEIKKGVLTERELENIPRRVQNSISDDTVDIFDGMMCSNINGKEFSEKINVSNYTKFVSSRTGARDYVHFVSSVEHIVVGNINSILRNIEFKNEVIELLQMSYDELIADLVILPDGNENYQPYIVYKNNNKMPLYCFGDGVQKIISIASNVANSRNGILLMDEFDIGLHFGIMNKAFELLISLCEKNNTQLFVTTHNVEAIDKFLHIKNNKLDDVRVISLYKEDSLAINRNLSGVEAIKVKDHLRMELR